MDCDNSIANSYWFWI